MLSVVSVNKDQDAEVLEDDLELIVPTYGKKTKHVVRLSKLDALSNFLEMKDESAILDDEENCVWSL